MSIRLRENLLRLMGERKINQIELSRLTKIPRTTINGYINPSSSKKAKLDVTQIKKMCEVLKTDFHELLFGTPDPHSKTSIPKEILTDIFRGDVRLIVQRIDRK